MAAGPRGGGLGGRGGPQGAVVTVPVGAHLGEEDAAEHTPDPRRGLRSRELPGLAPRGVGAPCPWL